jgi:hypothetical protein
MKLKLASKMPIKTCQAMFIPSNVGYTELQKKTPILANRSNGVNTGELKTG